MFNLKVFENIAKMVLEFYKHHNQPMSLIGIFGSEHDNIVSGEVLN